MKSAFYQHLGNPLCILIIAAFNFFFLQAVVTTWISVKSIAEQRSLA